MTYTPTTDASKPTEWLMDVIRNAFIAHMTACDREDGKPEEWRAMYESNVMEDPDCAMRSSRSRSASRDGWRSNGAFRVA